MLILEREREERNRNHGFWKQRCRGCLAASPYCSKTTMLRRKASRDLICTSPIYRSKFPSKTKKKNKLKLGFVLFEQVTMMLQREKLYV